MEGTRRPRLPLVRNGFPWSSIRGRDAMAQEKALNLPNGGVFSSAATVICRPDSAADALAR
ncbi:hypothetical protein [Streptomyces sp. SAS_272]|uniref:hypothetical protein n=1 Tax=Streptomyces sp. SAS_272 TaxID=3412747 RepID=UPI00403D4B5E